MFEAGSRDATERETQGPTWSGTEGATWRRAAAAQTPAAAAAAAAAATDASSPDPLGAARVATTIDVGSAGDCELMTAALDVESARRVLDAASTRLLGELDARGTTDVHEGMRTPRWLAHHAQLPAATASRRVRTARTLRDALPEVDDALHAGRIGLDHAHVLAEVDNPRIADEWPDAAAVLAHAVDGVVFEQWRRAVHNAAQRLDMDGPHDPADDATRNRLRKANTIDDTYLLNARLVGADGLVVHQTIDAVADELFHQALRDESLCPTDLRAPSRARLEALALVEICRRSLAVDVDSTKGPQTDITVVVNADEPDAVHTPDGTRLADGTTRHLLCDPRLLPVVTSRLGVPLDMGRAARFATGAQRRAMAVRDGGCVFPGCTSPPMWTDAHHLDEWSDDGRTDTARLASLCRHHHMVVHRTGWQLHSRADGTFWFTTPSGTSFWGQQHQQQPQRPTPDGQRPRQRGPDRC